MSERRERPPDYRTAAFWMGFSAFFVGLVTPPAQVVGEWLMLIGAVMIVASRKLSEPF